MSSTCRLIPLHVGECTLGLGHLFGEGYSDEQRTPFALYSFLVDGDEKALVDLGPMSLEYTNEMFRRYDFFREEADGRVHPDDIVQPHGNVFSNLQRLGVEPSEVAHIVFTHLHADHHGMDTAKNPGAAALFPNAVIHTSRRGWDNIVSMRRNGRWEGYIDHAFADYLLAQSANGKVRFEDDEEIFPGLRTHYLGGHSMCSQAVEVRTEEGPAFITSDDIYRYDLLADGVIAKLCVTPEALLASTRKLVELAASSDGILLPVHDPAIWGFYRESPDGWLRLAKEATRKAIEGFGRSKPKFAGVGL